MFTSLPIPVSMPGSVIILHHLKTFSMESRVKLGILLVVASGILLFVNLVAANVCGWIAEAFFLSFFSTTFRLAPHWRLLLVSTANLISSFILSVFIAHGRVSLAMGDSITMAVILWFTSCISLILVVLFPVPATDPLQGKYKCIGTSSLIVPGVGSKDLHIQVWYPVREESTDSWWRSSRSTIWTSGNPAHQIDEINHLITGMARTYGLPSTILSHLTFGMSNAAWNISCDDVLTAQTTNITFPVAIYSHGMYGWKQVHTSACEALASSGFVVIGVDHDPDCMMFRPVGSPHSSRYFDYDLPEGLSVKEEREFYSKGMDRRASDIIRVIDVVSSQDELRTLCPALAGRLDVESVHLWGHSFGGGTVATVCCRDYRVRSAVLLDSWMYPVPDEDRRTGSLSAELLVLSAGRWKYGKVRSNSIL